MDDAPPKPPPVSGHRTPPFSQQLHRGGLGAVAAGALAIPVAGGTAGWEGFTALTMLGFGFLLTARRLRHRGGRAGRGRRRLERAGITLVATGGAAAWLASALVGSHPADPAATVLAVAPWLLVGASAATVAVLEWLSPRRTVGRGGPAGGARTLPGRVR